jgi:predicted transcriptional regulator
MLSAFKQLLEKITSEKAPGPSPAFSVFHVLRAIELIAEKTIGRSRLAEELKVGEGTIRTIISRLKNAGLIKTSRLGCILTGEGLKLCDEYKAVFRKRVEIGENELTLANYNFAILVKNCGHKVKSGMKQRDAAIKVGARGATTIILKEGHLTIPSVGNDVAENFPKAANQITRLLQPEESDVIVIVSGDSSEKAEYGALAAVWTLIKDGG